MSVYAGRGGKIGSGNGTAHDTRPLISIAMCTCNGAQYLNDQLVSFVKQTRRPDELIACDDCSTDNTLQLLDQFSKEAPFPVKVYRNQQRLGPTKNFEKAISLCTGDLIFLSDQDDVWMPQKVSTLLQALRNNPGAGYVFSDSLIVDKMLRSMGRTVWQSLKFTRRQFQEDKQVAILLRYNVVTGATMAFQARLKSIVLPIPDESLHDEWIALLASSAGMYGIPIEEPLIQYRRHPGQLIGVRSFAEQVRRFWLMRGSSFDSLLRQQEAKYSKALDRLALTGQFEKDVQQLFEAQIQHLRVRQSIHKRPRCARFLAVSRLFLTLRYRRFSYGWKSAAMDLVL